MERILRMTSSEDCSEANINARSPRRHAASMKCAEILLLPVPAPPEMSMLLLRKKPFPFNIASSLGMPEDMRSSVAL